MSEPSNGEVCKFDELRIKTTRQLIQLVNKEIELGTSAFADGRLLKAKRACAEASRLLALLEEIPDEKRRPLQARVRNFQALIEDTSIPGLRGDVAALARALWIGRGCPEGSPEEDGLRAERVLKSHAEFETASTANA